MGEQGTGMRPGGGGTDQSEVLRKLAGRLDGLRTGEVPRLIRPGEDGYGEGPAMPHIDPDEYRAETGKEWVPTAAAAAPESAQPAVAASAPAASAPAAKAPQGKAPQGKAPQAKGPQAKSKGPQGKGPQGKPKAKQGRPAQQAQAKGAQQGRPAQQAKPRPPAPAGTGRPRAPQGSKRPGFWARLWAKLTGG